MSANNVLSRFQPAHHLRAGVFVLLGLLAAFQVNAQEVTAQDSAFRRFMYGVTSPGTQTVGFGSNGTPVVNPGLPRMSVDGAATFGVSRAGTLPLGAGASLPISARAKIVGASAGRIIGKALPLLGPLGTAASVLLLAHELAFDLSKDSVSGAVTVTKSNTLEIRRLLANACQGNAQVDGSLSSLASVCQARYQSGVYSGSTCYPSGTTQIYCDRGPYGPVTLGTQFVSSNVTWVPSTDQELIDAIAAKSGWPAASAIAKALDDAQRVTGDVVDTEGPKMTGPASVAGPKAVTTNGNTTTTKQSNFDCIYVDGPTVMDGGSVVCTEKIKTTTEVTSPDPVTGQPVKTTTGTEETIKPVDTPEPAKTDCDKNPKSNGCRTDEYDTPTGDIPKSTKTVSYTPESWFGGGSCPADKVMTTRSGQVLKVWDWQASCGWITTYFRPILLICASFGALMLLVPKGES